MKRKFMTVLACALAVVGLLPVGAGASPATVLTPGVQQAVGENGCNVSVMHGNFSTTAFSQFSYTPDFVPPEINQCNTEGTYIVSYALTDGNVNPNGTRKWTQERCYIASNVNFPDFGDGACNRWTSGSAQWTQSNKTNSTIVGTQAHVCGDVILCESVGDASFNPRYAAASPTLAHGSQTTLNKGLCSVTFMHGDFSTSAFSQMRYSPASGACATENSFVELAAIDALGNLSTQRCPLSGSGSGSGSCNTWADQNAPLHNWYQALFTNKHIVGSTVRLCDDDVVTPCADFYRTGF